MLKKRERAKVYQENTESKDSKINFRLHRIQSIQWNCQIHFILKESVIYSKDITDKAGVPRSH